MKSHLLARIQVRSQAQAPAYPARQRGVALIVGLVLLVLLALMGASAYSVATQEERMAGNARDHARAFEAAEYALRECEKAVLAVPVFDPTGTTNRGMYLAATNGQLIGDDPVAPANWTTTYPLAALNGATAQPLCIAEEIKTPPLHPGTLTLLPGTARVTAVGYGSSTNTKVMLVSYVNFLPAN